MAFYIQDHLVTAGCQFFTSRYTGCPIRVFTTDTPFRGALVLMRCLELLPRRSRSLILVSSRSMNLGSVSFDDSRLDQVRWFSTRSRLNLVRWLSITFVDSRLALVFCSHLKEGLSCHVSHLEWGLVQSVYGPFYTRTFLEVIFASFSVDPLETHWFNNNLLTHWRPLRLGIVYKLSPHHVHFLTVDLLETRWVNNKSLTQWRPFRLGTHV